MLVNTQAQQVYQTTVDKALPWLLLPWLAAKRYYRDGCAGASAALTYTTLFALVPLFTLFISVFNFFPESQQYQQQLLEQVMGFLVPQVGETVQSYLQTFSGKASQLTAIGLVILLVTSVLMIYNIEQAFNTIWRVQRSRRSLYAFMLYWTLLTLGPILLGAALALSASLSGLAWWTDLPLGGRTWQLWVARGLEVLAFTLLYWAIPNYAVRLRHALFGGLLMALLFELAKRLFSLFIQLFPSYEFIYGAFAAVPLFLLWMYLSWQMILYCAQWVAILDLGLVQHKRRPPLPLALQPVQALALLWQAFQRGEGLSEERLRRACGYPQPEQWHSVMDWLQLHWMIADSKGQWRLRYDLHNTPANDWLQSLPWRLPLLDEWPEDVQSLQRLRDNIAATEKLQSELWQGSVADLLGKA